MMNFSSMVRFGFSPTMLFPASFEDPLVHFAAIEMGCRYPHCEAFETFLPEDPAMRAACVREIRVAGIEMHYNSPGIFQVEGPVNPGSDDASVRAQALRCAKMHVDFAAECESPIFVTTGCLDKGEERRQELTDRYFDFFMALTEHARQYGIDVLLEPIERHRFKKLILGPTPECAAFIARAQKAGAENAHLMLDTAHLPLMEETMEDALAASMPVGLKLIHIGDAVLDPANEFYGHTHPPIGVQGGTFDWADLVEQFAAMLRCGYISPESGKPANVSLEVKPYPGVSGATSIQVMYEKCRSAFAAALEQVSAK